MGGQLKCIKDWDHGLSSWVSDYFAVGSVDYYALMTKAC